MTQEPRAGAASSRLGSTTNALAAFVVAVYAVWALSDVRVIWDPGRYGDLGLTIGGNGPEPADNSSYLVKSIVPGYAADKAGIKVGDRVDSALPTRARLVLDGLLAPRPGEKVTIQTSRGSTRRTLTLQARPLAPLPVGDRVKLALVGIANFIFVAVGVALVLLRPS